MTKLCPPRKFSAYATACVSFYLSSSKTFRGDVCNLGAMNRSFNLNAICKSILLVHIKKRLHNRHRGNKKTLVWFCYFSFGQGFFTYCIYWPLSNISNKNTEDAFRVKGNSHPRKIPFPSFLWVLTASSHGSTSLAGQYTSSFTLLTFSMHDLVQRLFCSSEIREA